MAHADIVPSWLNSNTSWSPTVGSFSGGGFAPNYAFCLRAHGSGDYLYNFPGARAIAQMLPLQLLSVIPAGSIVTDVFLNAFYDSAAPGLQVSVQYNPPFGPDSGFVTTVGGPQLVALHVTGVSYSRFDLANSVLQFAANNNVTGPIHIDWFALSIDYTPPADGLVTIYTAGAYPISCPQPSAKRFKPFGQFDSGAGLQQEVTAAWMRRYGKPPAGYQLWTYYRAADYGFTLGAASPVTTWILDPWPPPN